MSGDPILTLDGEVELVAPAPPRNGRKEPSARVSTGIDGLDEVLNGGLIVGRTYLARGGPGTGKTTLGLHFLVAGARKGEPVLLISLGEPEEELRKNAEAFGFDLDGVTFLDLSPTPEFFAEVETYDIFSPAEVEREPTTRKIVEKVDEIKPRRVFLDGMTQFRYLTADPFQFRKEVLSFLRFLEERGATVLFTSEESPMAPDDDLQFMADGVIDLTIAADERSVRIIKFRGSGFRGGRHSMRFGKGGLEVFPRLVPGSRRVEFARETVPSGVPELDELLHGGIERGTLTVISGPTGVGKTTLGLQFIREAAGRGERSVAYLFEESLDTVLGRCDAVQIPARAMIERGTLDLVAVEPLQLASDEFADMVRDEVEHRGARIVMVDTLAGYRLSLRDEDATLRLHALGRYLKNMGVTAIFTSEVDSITGEFRTPGDGVSYLADNIIFLRYLEMCGEMRKAVGVLKKRLTSFERTLREFEITPYGIKVGNPLTGLRGILRGIPEFIEPKQGG